MKNLYEFEWSFRGGNVCGRFLATAEDVENITNKEVYFGEILGKHSEIYGRMDEGDIKLVTDNQEFISMAAKIRVCLESGYNPFHYLSEEEESEEYLNDLESDRDD